jgi:signal transduction histidine kinase
MTRFTLRYAREGGSLILYAEDDGSGIPVADKERVFERGFGHNTGLGLFLARDILGITGITIRETGEPGKGARFEMTVPPGAFRFPEHQKDP